MIPVSLVHSRLLSFRGFHSAMSALLTGCLIVQISSVRARKGNACERGLKREMLNIESKKGNLKQIEVENTYLFLFYLLSLYFCMKSNVKEYGVSKHL